MMDRLSSYTHRVVAALLTLVMAAGMAGGAVQTAHAQEEMADSLAEGRGTAQLLDWPDATLADLLDQMGRHAPRLLPRLDSMALDYGYVAGDSTSDWSFEVTWRPGARVLHEGRVKAWSEAPADIRMTSLEVLGDVVVNGETVTQMIIAVDSMALQPYPDAYTFDVTVGHDRVFLETTPEEARSYLQEGITITNLVVERMGFDAFDPSTGEPTGQATGDARPRADEPETAPRQEPEPRRPRVYEPRTSILIGWRIGPRPYYVGSRGAPRGDDRRAARPRGETTGDAPDRAATRGNATRGDADRTDADRAGADRPASEGRTADARRSGDRGDEGEGRATTGRTTRSGDDGSKDGRSKRGGSKDDNDDEDDESLAIPALGAAAAVGILAYAGGTVGLSGTGETPLGLTAGYTQPGGGVQLQASVNPAVVEQVNGQRLSVKALGFYDVFASRVQPALGLGVQARGDDRVTLHPAASVGLVGNLGRFVLYGGFDVAQLTPEVSLAYNFRFRPDDGDEAIAEK